MVGRFLLGAVLIVCGFATIAADFHYSHAAHLHTILPGVGFVLLGALIVEPSCVGPALKTIADTVRSVWRPKLPGGDA